MLHLDAHAPHQQFGGEMRAGAIAGRAVVQLARLPLRERDQFLQVLHRQVVSHHKGVREGARARERGEIRDGIIARLLHQQHVVAMRLVVAEGDGVAIGLGLRHGARADGARSPGTVFNDHLLFQVFLDIRSDDPRDDIGWSARRIGHHDRDGARWEARLGTGHKRKGECSARASERLATIEHEFTP